MTFCQWWHEIGSGMSFRDGQDIEEFAMTVALAAWMASLDSPPPLRTVQVLVDAVEAGKTYADALGNYSEHAGKVIGGVKYLDDLFEDWQEKQDAALEAAKGGV